MLRMTLWLLVGVFVWGFASCSIKCPDGNVCPDTATCCRTTQGYRCCRYPHAVCCADLASCCPFGYRCNLATQMCVKEWMKIPMVTKEAAEKPSAPLPPTSPIKELDNNHVPEQQKASVVHCDNYHMCPDGTTCCRHPAGVWFCCPYTLGRCCRDGFHCCPYGYDCDYTYTHCVRQGLRYPFSPQKSLSSFPASPIATSKEESSSQKEAPEKPSAPLPPTSPIKELDNNHVPEQQKASVVHCDNYHMCPDGTTCCRHPAGVWFCCPYTLGRCCRDGFHCCPYGYDCDLTYTHCVRQGLRYPFSPQKSLSSFPASVIATSEDESSSQKRPMTALTKASAGKAEGAVIRCDSSFYCKPGTSCCKDSTGHWSCCPFPLGQCCADGRHCCEYGYNCDPTSLTCRRWYSQVPSGSQEDAKKL